MTSSTDAAAAAPTPPTATSDELLKALVLQGHRLHGAVSAVGAAHQLTADEWLILDALHSHDGLTMSQISALTPPSGASLTRAVDRLVTRSLVYRTPSLTDRRKVDVRISDAGRDLHAVVSAELADLTAELDAAMAEDALDPGAFAAVLNRLPGLA